MNIHQIPLGCDHMSELDVKPIKAGQVKVGNYILYDGDVYIVKDNEKSKAGKHGHAKCRMAIENVFTGSKKSIVVPADDKLQSPIINKKTAQVLAITPDSVQLMDLESYETFETIIPNDEELKSKLEPNKEVEYWEVVGKRVLRRVK